MAFGVEAWFCCLANEERYSLKFTFDNVPRFLPHISKVVWELALTGYGIDPTTDRYRDFVEIYLIYFVTQEIAGIEVEVVEIPDEFYFALDAYFFEHGSDCPDPCIPLEFSYL